MQRAQQRGQHRPQTKESPLPPPTQSHLRPKSDQHNRLNDSTAATGRKTHLQPPPAPAAQSEELYPPTDPPPPTQRSRTTSEGRELYSIYQRVMASTTSPMEQSEQDANNTTHTNIDTLSNGY
jgi:hypothetical protein